jgi:hypothetical protein
MIFPSLCQAVPTTMESPANNRRCCTFSGYLRVPTDIPKYAPFFMQPHDVGACREGKARERCAGRKDSRGGTWVCLYSSRYVHPCSSLLFESSHFMEPWCTDVRCAQHVV